MKDDIEEFKKNLLRTINAGIITTNTKDDYSCGIRNGMRWCRSLLDDKEPQYEHIERPGWIPCSERLPKENVYVLVWCGEVKIARIIRGISKEQRTKMQEGAIDDPVSWGWNLSNGYFKVKRSESYRACDENGNNKVPYCWDCTYGEMFGQDVKYWMPLPYYPEGEQNDTAESQ